MIRLAPSSPPATNQTSLTIGKQKFAPISYQKYQHRDPEVRNSWQAADLIEPVATRIHERIEEACLDIQEEELPPTDAAKTSLDRILAGTEKIRRRDFRIPLPLVTFRGDGDLSLTWREGRRELYFAIFPDGSSRLQRFEGPGSEAVRVDENPDARQLIDSVNWLGGDDRRHQATGRHRPGGNLAEGDTP